MAYLWTTLNFFISVHKDLEWSPRFPKAPEITDGDNGISLVFETTVTAKSGESIIKIKHRRVMGLAHCTSSQCVQLLYKVLNL